MSQSHDRRVVSRLESLPTELIENIAECLDTTSHKQLRLSSRYLDAMSTHTFGARIKSAAFFFTRTSMERLALLSESTRWTKYVNCLEINKSCLRSSEWARWLNHWSLHQEQTYRDPLRRVPGWKLHFEPMTAVQTLVVDLYTFVDNECIYSQHYQGGRARKLTVRVCRDKPALFISQALRRSPKPHRARAEKRQLREACSRSLCRRFKTDCGLRVGSAMPHA